MKKRDYILVFNDWKEWTLKNKKTPRKLSDNEYESKLCTDMQGIIVILRKYPEAYNEIIYEYNNLIDMYGGRRSKKQRLQEWEEWIITNKKVPRPTSKDREEARIANITSQIIKKMRRNPELYSEELMRYKVVKGIYLKKGRGKENVLKTFREWKNFADSNGYIPKSNSSDDNERKIANNFYYTLKRMRNNPSLYKEELEEYSKILHASKPKSLKHKYKQEFLKHKEWIIANSKFPKQTSEDISERRLAGRMERIFRILKNDPDSFKQEIFELELLYKQYKKTSARDVEQIFKKWKEWCEKNKRTPKYTAVNREEVALYRQIYNALIRMRENPTYYSLCLQEYDEIYNKYNGDVYESYYEAFNEWKK